jgi:hypothetical protein
MLINNLGSLKAELSRYLMHQRFAPDYDTAVQNFENLANRRLRVRPMELWVTLTPVGGSSPLPGDYLLWRSVLWMGHTPEEIEIDYVHPAYLHAGSIERGSRMVFTIEGNNLFINPHAATGNDVIKFHYYQKIPSITGNDNDSNWLLAAHSDLYLEGTLFELFMLGRNIDGNAITAASHKQLRDEKFAEAIQLYALTTGASSSSVRAGVEYF